MLIRGENQTSNIKAVNLSYLNKFRKISEKLEPKLMSEFQMEINTGCRLDSVVLTIRKKNWYNSIVNDEKKNSSIFFSVWIEDKSLIGNQIFYNIHALKLRHLNGYIIESRKFAEAFRDKFMKYKDQWPNVSISYGPQTLMQGRIEINTDSFEADIIALIIRFLEIEFIIDDLLEERKSIL